MKLMFAFLTILVMFSSMTLSASEKAPTYETPVIVKQGGLVGTHKKVALNTNQLVNLFFNLESRTRIAKCSCCETIPEK